MREIKFRAWDKKNKIMLSHDRLFRLDCSNEYPFLGVIGGYYNDCMEKLNVEADGIMQFTGLTDKNGVMIYEGDIVKAPYDFCDNHTFERSNGEFLGVVTYEGCSYHIKQDNDDYHPNLINHTIKYLEVIGNIHQAKEE